MDFTPTLEAIRNTGVATLIRETVWLFPLIEATHVIGLTLVFGTIMIVDLRLIGVASRERPFRRLSNELLRWTWIAFALALVTGALMFATDAVVYAGNLAFQLKMLLLVLAGANMGVFHVMTLKTVEHWDTAPRAPQGARIAGMLSLALWIAVIVSGRIIGFTTGGASADREETAPPADVNFEDFLSGAPTDAPPPQAAP